MTTPAKPLHEIEKEAILAAVARNAGNKALAAKELGISLKTIYNKLNRYEYQARRESTS